jgi:hypothetical protein
MINPKEIYDRVTKLKDAMYKNKDYSVTENLEEEMEFVNEMRAECIAIKIKYPLFTKENFKRLNELWKKYNNDKS